MEVTDLSLDTVTVVGKMKARKTGRTVVVGQKNRVEEVDSRVMQMLRGERDAFGVRINYLNDEHWLRIQELPDYKSPIYNWRFHIGEHAFLQINTGVDRTGNNFRLEWNPNLIEEWEKVYLYELLMHVESKRFTRLDLALDFSVDLSRWKIVDDRERKRRYYESGKGKLETRYCGTHYSDVEVRIYDKIKEREDKAHEEYEGIWWRMEETIRNKAIENWENHEWFSGIRLIKGKTGYKEVDEINFPEGMRPNEIAQVIACLVKSDLINEFAKATRAKIRKKIDSLARFEEIEKEFRPWDYIKKKRLSDLGEIKKSLKQIIKL